MKHLTVCTATLLACTSTFALSPKKIAACKQKAWAEYAEQLHKDATLQLPTLHPLNDEAHTWTLPMGDGTQCTMPFYYGTKGNRPEAGYPLFLYIHGSGPKEHEWSTGLRLAQAWQDSPSIYFVPQIPDEGRYRWYQQEKQTAWEALFLRALASPDIDPERLYLLGISEGGYGSQRLASFYADYLAAAGPMAGGEPLRNAPVENLQHIAFSLRTGDKDKGFYRDLLTGYTREALDSMTQAYPGQYTHWVTHVEGYGHSIPYGPTAEWLKQHKRQARPTSFIWEQYPMDGRYRYSWYNLVVPDQLDASKDERRRYEVSIKDNVVDIKVSEVHYEVTELDPHWGIQLKCKRDYTPVTPEHLAVYLDDTMVDTQRPVTLRINGETRHKGKLRPSTKAIHQSITLWGDPLRIYEYCIEV